MAAVIGRGITNGLNGITFSGNNHGIGEVYDESHSRKCLQSKFAPYLTVAITLNSIAVLAGVLSQFDFHYNQRSTRFDEVDSWYVANAIFGIIHILAAIYIVYKIEQPIQVKNGGGRGTRGIDVYGNNNNPPPTFDYNYFDGEAPPPPQNPDYAQGHDVAVVRMDKSRRAPQPPPAPSAPFPYSPPRVPPKMVTQPLTSARMKRVLCEDKFVALYIIIFALYLAWHYFMDFNHMNYRYHRGMQFVMHCADTFIMAGPASLLFSVVWVLATNGNS